MPSRNMIKANKTIFEGLDEHCRIRGEPINNAGTARWIDTTDREKRFLKTASLVRVLSLSPSLKIARFDYSGRSFFVTAGLELLGLPEGMEFEELNAGILTGSLAEMEVRPIARPVEIRQVLEVGDKADSKYRGHDHLQIASLFPPIQVLSTDALADSECSEAFFLLCLSERRRFDYWIEESLASALKQLTNVSAKAIPYESLCRAVLDFDPTALFLALYRSLEALYSREKAQALMSALGIQKGWSEVSQLLEEHLNWYPREETSLEALFKYAKDVDLTAVLESIGVSESLDSKLHGVVAKRIYALRNALVHYRPFHQLVSFDEVNWNKLCEAISRLVVHLYDFPADSGADAESGDEFITAEGLKGESSERNVLKPVRRHGRKSARIIAPLAPSIIPHSRPGKR